MGVALRERIIRRFGQWVVTKSGLRAADGTYDIEASRLWDRTFSWGWEEHMAEKNWVIMSEFRAALAFAREYHAAAKPKDLDTGA